MTNENAKANAFNVRKTISTVDRRPDAAVVSDNFSEEKQVGMTFNMPRSWHTEFKIAAASQGVPMREFLMTLFAEWKSRQK